MVHGEPYKNWVMKEFPKVVELYQKLNIPEEKVEELSRNSTSRNTMRDSNGHVTTADIDLLWAKIDEMYLAMMNQDTVMQSMIERCLDIELKTNEHSSHFDTTLPNDLVKLEDKIDKRCALFMETTSNSAEDKVEELKTNVTSQLNSLKNKIGKFKKN